MSELKSRGDGTIVALGSGVLVQALIEHNLIDEYRVYVHPLVLGKGQAQPPTPTRSSPEAWR